MNGLELAAQLRITAAFIAANPVTVALIPRTTINTGTGTRLVDGEPRDLQTFRIIDQTRTFGPEPGTIRASDGKQRMAEFQLLGDRDAVMGLYDHWTDSKGIKWEIANLLPDNGYERRAQVVRLGES